VLHLGGPGISCGGPGIPAINRGAGGGGGRVAGVYGRVSAGNERPSSSWKKNSQKLSLLLFRIVNLIKCSSLEMYISGVHKCTTQNQTLFRLGKIKFSKISSIAI